MSDPKPTDFPDYATADNYTFGPDNGNPTKEALLPVDVEQGNVAGEANAPRAQKFNFWMNLVGLWIRWFNDHVFTTEPGEFAALPAAALAVEDIFAFEDADDANEKKQTTVQDILDLTGGGGGGVQILATVAALKALDASTLAVGSLLEVVTFLDQVIVVSDAALLALADGITLIAPTVPTGDKVYVRRNLSNALWRAQATWVIDEPSGNDENSGVDLANALKSAGELRRRVGKTPDILQDTIVTLADDLATIDLGYFDWNLPEGHTLTLQGTIQIAASGTLTGATTRDVPTKQRQLVEDTDIGTFAGKRINYDGNGYAFIHKAGTSGDQAITGPTTNGHVPAAAGDYDIEDLPEIRIAQLSCTGTASPLVLIDSLSVKIDSTALMPTGSVYMTRSRMLSGARVAGRSVFIFEACSFQDVNWVGADAQFKLCLFEDQQRFNSGCSVYFDDENDSAETFNERTKFDGSIGPIANRTSNVVTIREGASLFVTEPTQGDVRTCGGFVNEGDIMHVAGTLTGPDNSVTLPEIGLAIYGKVFKTSTGTIALTGSDGDFRLGNTADNSWGAGFASDLNYGAVYEALDETV